jgi:uncharacterized protein
MDVEFPFRFDEYGRTARAPYDEHVKDMLVQLLLVAPGERVMRPDFGAGLLRLVFEPNTPELAAARQATALAEVERWLGDIVAVERLVAEADGPVFRLELGYRLLATGQTGTLELDVPGAT